MLPENDPQDGIVDLDVSRGLILKEGPQQVFEHPACRPVRTGSQSFSLVKHVEYFSVTVKQALSLFFISKYFFNAFLTY